MTTVVDDDVEYGYSQKQTAEAIADEFVARNIGESSGESLVRSVSKKWRDDFPGSSLSNTEWDVIQVGTGQSITVSGSELRVASGTAANSETIIRSKEAFTISFKVSFLAMLSQRIANQEIYLEIVDATSGHYASWIFDGASATSVKTITSNSGSTIGGVSAAVSTTSTIQFFEIDSFSDEINFFTRASDSVLARGFNVSRTRRIPDPNLLYFVQIRVKNLATSPASSTTLTLDSVSAQDIHELTTEITGGRGGGNANQSIPVFTVAGSAVSAAISSSVSVFEALSYAVETTTLLAANGVLTGASRDALNRPAVRLLVFTDQSGTLFVEQSHDNIAFRQTHSFPVTGNTTQATLIAAPLFMRFFRVRYTNGAVAQTVFFLHVTQRGFDS